MSNLKNDPRQAIVASIIAIFVGCFILLMTVAVIDEEKSRREVARSQKSTANTTACIGDVEYIEVDSRFGTAYAIHFDKKNNRPFFCKTTR